MRIGHIFFALLATCVATTMIASDVHAAPGKKPAKGKKLYKWVDKNGVTQFGNAIPPEYASQGGEQISKSGQTLRTIEAEKTPEELAELAKQKEIEDAAKQVAVEAARRDRMLLGTYPTIADLTRVRDAKVQALETQARLSSSTVSSLERELVKLNKQEAAAHTAGKTVPEKVASEKARVSNELLANQRFVLDKQTEIEAANAQYEKDRARLIELRGGADGN